MGKLNNLKPEKVIKAFERDNWVKVKSKKGSSHVILKKEGYEKIISIPVHKGKDIKIELLKAELKKAGLTEDEFLELY